MKRISAIFFSLGLSVALIALAVWFLTSQHGLYRFASGRWFVPHGMMDGQAGVVMMLFWVIVIVALIMLVSGVFINRSSPSVFSHGEPDAIQILKRRYANGDIDQAEYEARRRELSS